MLTPFFAYFIFFSSIFFFSFLFFSFYTLFFYSSFSLFCFIIFFSSFFSLSLLKYKPTQTLIRMDLIVRCLPISPTLGPLYLTTQNQVCSVGSFFRLYSIAKVPGCWRSSHVLRHRMSPVLLNLNLQWLQPGIPEGAYYPKNMYLLLLFIYFLKRMFCFDNRVISR